MQGLRAQWEAELCRALRETKASEAHAAREGRPTLFPYLCLLSEGEFAGLLLQVRSGHVGAGPGVGRARGVRGSWRRRAQTLQALPPQGESLLSLAQQLGLRIFNRHVVQRKRLTEEVQALERRYFKYLHLLASDTQVRPGGHGIRSLPPGPGIEGLLRAGEPRWVSRWGN